MKDNRIAVSKEYFDTQVEKQLDLLVFAECKKDTKNLANITPLATKLRSKAVGIINEEMRVKGTRSGHINHAPEEIQTKYNQCKELLEDCTWSTDGIEYTVTLIAKKVVTEKVEA
tara:strand:+ start:506 stop:850 length:345 start_codon:yes stop_codon:yes gene_type:complete